MKPLKFSWSLVLWLRYWNKQNVPEVRGCKVCSFEYCHTVITTEHTCFHTIAIDLCSLKGIATSLQWNIFFICFLSYYCNLFCICVFVTQLHTVSFVIVRNSYPFLAVQYFIEKEITQQRLADNNKCRITRHWCLG